MNPHEHGDVEILVKKTPVSCLLFNHVTNITRVREALYATRVTA